MFDAEKIRRLTYLLQRLPEEFSDVYILHEGFFLKMTAALFRRLKIPVRALIHDSPSTKEVFDIPIVTTAEAAANFNERTILIKLLKKTAPFIQTTVDFKTDGGTWSLPALVLTNDEAETIYERVLLLRYVNSYAEDGMPLPQPEKLPEKFARGLTTFLEPRFQNFKCQVWDTRDYYKPTYTFDDTAIVIQGPIAYNDNYTVDTFKLYRSVYSRAPIIVSTWKNEATDDFRRACAENSVVLLENEMPADPGAFNMNLQLDSSLAGVKFVRENTAAKFVLKTRCDQRMNRFDFLVYFKNLLETFPPRGDKLLKRIIFLGSDNSRGWPFFFIDFLSFGRVEDISKLYSISRHHDLGEMTYFAKNGKRRERLKYILFRESLAVDYNLPPKKNHKLRKFNRLMSRFSSAEDYLAKTFYREFIAPIDPDKILETGWKFTADYLIFVDTESILFDWPKYESARFYPTVKGQFTFARWLDMFRNFKTD